MQSNAVGHGDGALEQRIAEVAHDLRTPLALIEAQCGFLASTLDGQEQLLEVERIRATARTMSARVDGLMVSGAAPRVPLDLAQLAAETVEDLRPLARARGTDIALGRCDDAVVLGDADGLRLALQNLIDNALRHAERAPVAVSVRCTRRAVALAVGDDGPGIPADLRRTLLAKGGQSAGDGRRPGAAGLGLGIASDVLRAHAGRIEIADAPQGGALVTLVLPTARPQRLRGRVRLRARSGAPQPAGWR